MLILGLTGGIATGKSTVSNLFKSKNVTVIDCDDIAHDVTKKNNAGYKRIVRSFGRSILQPDGEIDRQALGKLVFEDAEARRRLNRATHPAVTCELARQLLFCFVRLKRLVVLDMPLLYETGGYMLTWPRLLVTSDPAVQVERLVKRDKCSRQLAEAKIASQMPQERKQQMSQYIVDNSGSHNHTADQVDRIVVEIQKGLFWKGAISTPATLLAIAAFALNSLISSMQ